ncbi:bifunctional glutamate N-acetyltransferase/amino-acid acetyltransferase ArgJ [Tepidiforma sp.]|uniref:bifunctional glutamate N-acetyltransferase/amino-acid acetyltransferase ArgJ n=1 Tax=Tepidiforma sp. TaxID=2682230 RepID=UPI0021DD598E|nr:bifunctional glutamate N-acetyltransferase/amino-acid acetyltransferase ArgJ [Tepidiforma sp.]MCX7617398.1 bifunctional glutamate N-acetyltransferase/amino-acid acetyltransferase ArgJ [Tepidiforma sp.]GIW17407.1 MAG: arginine biosynthesis bifunctional protein ArgJ [Tepidiforma sp.]
MQVDPAGHVTSPRGFLAGAAYAGVKTYGEGKLDLAILVSERPCSTAAVFTRSRLHAAAVDIDRAKLAIRPARGVVVNAGVANASTGERGMADGYELARLAAARAGVPEEEMLVCSTGVIGHFLPMEKLAAAMPAIELAPAGGPAFARAIMTTDTRPKTGAVQFGPYTIGGACKGSGMIHPDMATMLAFLTTDAPVEPGFLETVFRRAVDDSFNLVSVDGDTSPSDTAVVFANGAAGGEPITAAHPLAAEFEAALRALCIHLAKAIARDGEGATKLVEFTVTGAATADEARRLVRLLSTSYLLKSAIHGADPNWGRIAAVVGRSGVQLDEPAVAIDLCGTRVYERGRPTAFDPDALSAAMRGADVSVAVHLGVGNEAATGWGCDLSAEYVAINADYHT